MTEGDARAWIAERHGVSRETMIARFVDLVAAEARVQNLVGPSTLDHMWARHVVNSAQLIDLAKGQTGRWIDVGTGAGFPGVVVACIWQGTVVLCEPRKRRAAFLDRAITALGLSAHCEVLPARVERAVGTADIISARAVSSLSAVLEAAHHLSSHGTIWLLPKGRNAGEEVAAARETWQGSFHVERSLTQPNSSIVVAKGIARK